MSATRYKATIVCPPGLAQNENAYGFQGNFYCHQTAGGRLVAGSPDVPPLMPQSCPQGGTYDGLGYCVLAAPAAPPTAPPAAPPTPPPAAPPPPPTPPAATPPTIKSITISPFTGGQGTGFGTMYEGVKRAYTVNENVGQVLVGWFVNDTRVSTGTQFNFKGNAGDRIYAILDPDKGGMNAGLQGGVRSNTFVFNPSGADGAGAQGSTGDLDGDGIPDDKDLDRDGDGIPDAEDHDIDGDGVLNEDDDDIDGDGIVNHQDPTPAGANVSTYDTLYTRASQAQYLGDVFHADPSHTNPQADKEEGFSIPIPLLVMAGLAGAFLLYNNRRQR